MKIKACLPRERYVMTSQSSAPDPEEKPANTHPAICKRPGCGNPLPVTGRTRGRARQFCSNECARRYHNDARIPAPRSATAETDDPLAALDALIRHVAVLVRAARDQVASQAARAQSQVQELTAEVQALTRDLEAARRAEADARAEAARLARDEPPGTAR
jgi:hypothetical protein